MAKPTKPSPELASWIDLNDALMNGDLQLAERLLKEEQANKKRKQFMLRIHSRINKLRAKAERKALFTKASS